MTTSSTTRVQRLREKRAAAKIRRIEISSDWEEHFAYAIMSHWQSACALDSALVWQSVEHELEGAWSLALWLDPSHDVYVPSCFLIDIARERRYIATNA